METKKRVYIGLLVGSMFLAALLTAAGWYLALNREFILSRVLLIIIIAVLVAFFILMGIGIIALVIMLIRSKTIPSLDSITRIANEVMFPIALGTGRLVGISKEKILRSYIEVNNNLVKSKKLLLEGRQVLILLPHCLQDSDCPHKITMDINNCQQCGKCSIAEIIALGEKYNTVIKVATGGTLARKFIEESRPRGVVAVACERDLSMGIHDASALPVMGVLNCRPNGPCINTDVDLAKIEEAILTICKGG
ncbi:MAG: DUF116 domain-containing protein [Syntrophomonadaceae bacterium]